MRLTLGKNKFLFGRTLLAADCTNWNSVCCVNTWAAGANAIILQKKRAKYFYLD
jgi:hypothetical protein